MAELTVADLNPRQLRAAIYATTHAAAAIAAASNALEQLQAIEFAGTDELENWLIAARAANSATETALWRELEDRARRLMVIQPD